jgi:BMFP domain-containing protein YqiC
LADAQNLEVDDKKLYETYPELSKDIKTQIRSQFKSQIEQLDADQELIDNPLSSKEKA